MECVLAGPPEPAVRKSPLQAAGIVGDDGIDPQVDHRIDVMRLVHRPDSDNQTEFPRAREHYQRALAKYEAAGAGGTAAAEECREFLTG